MMLKGCECSAEECSMPCIQKLMLLKKKKLSGFVMDETVTGKVT